MITRLRPPYLSIPPRFLFPLCQAAFCVSLLLTPLSQVTRRCQFRALFLSSQTRLSASPCFPFLSFPCRLSVAWPPRYFPGHSAPPNHRLSLATSPTATWYPPPPAFLLPFRFSDTGHARPLDYVSHSLRFLRCLTPARSASMALSWWETPVVLAPAPWSALPS